MTWRYIEYPNCAAGGREQAHPNTLLACASRLLIHADGNRVGLAHEQVHEVAVVPAQQRQAGARKHAAAREPHATCTATAHTALGHAPLDGDLLQDAHQLLRQPLAAILGRHLRQRESELSAAAAMRVQRRTVTAVTWPCQFSPLPSALPMTAHAAGELRGRGRSARRGATHCSPGRRRPAPPRTENTPATAPGTAGRTAGGTAPATGASATQSQRSASRHAAPSPSAGLR